MSPETFVKEFAPALQEYLEYHYRDEGHLLDMISASADFFSVSFHSVSASISALDYTEPATSKRRASSKK